MYQLLSAIVVILFIQSIQAKECPGPDVLAKEFVHLALSGFGKPYATASCVTASQFPYFKINGDYPDLEENKKQNYAISFVEPELPFSILSLQEKEPGQYWIEVEINAFNKSGKKKKVIERMAMTLPHPDSTDRFDCMIADSFGSQNYLFQRCLKQEFLPRVYDGHSSLSPLEKL